MFQVSFKVEDDDLPAVLRKLDNLTTDLSISPVSVAQTVGITAENGGSPIRQAILDYIKGKTIVTPREVMGIVANSGGSPRSYPYHVKKLMQGGFLKKGRLPRTYSVHTPQSAGQ